MAQRNPLNERYQQREGGKTRKSAASAKPVTKAASSVYIKDPNAKPKKSFLDRFNKKEEEPVKKKKTQQVQATEAQEAQQPKKKGGKWTLNDMEGSTPDQSLEGLTPEQKKAVRKKYLNPGNREYKRWRAIWWVLIVCGLATLVPQFFMPDLINQMGDNLMILYGLGYAFIIGAIVIDALKIRPLRKKAHGDAISSNRSKEATKARKEAKKEAIAKEEAKLAKKAARKR